MRHILTLPFAILSCISVMTALPVQQGESDERLRESATADVRPAADALSYRIQRNDVLEIFVWKEPELSRKVTVRPDGRISLPLIQDMTAAGISPAELKEQIEKKLKDYLDAPNVTIIVDSIQSYTVFVTGKVQKPGAIPSGKPITVLQALAMAGGFQEYANPAAMTVFTKVGNKSVSLSFNYTEVIKGRNSEQNILLSSGDVVVVP